MVVPSGSWPNSDFVTEDDIALPADLPHLQVEQETARELSVASTASSRTLCAFMVSVECWFDFRLINGSARGG